MKYKDSNGNIKELVIRGKFDNVLTKNNLDEYIPTNDYNPATKKYVDDITYIHKFEVLQKETPEIKIKNIETIKKYLADTNINKKIIASIEGVINVEMICSVFENEFSATYSKIMLLGQEQCILWCGTIDYKIDTEDYTSTNNMKLIPSANEVLVKGNNVSYIPTTDYSPATKKYVDDNKTTVYRFKYRATETTEQKQQNINTIKSYLTNISDNKRFIFDIMNNNGNIVFSIESKTDFVNNTANTFSAYSEHIFIDGGFLIIFPISISYSNEDYIVESLETILATMDNVELIVHQLLKDKLYTVTISNNTLTLTDEKYQNVVMTDNTVIKLPTVTEFKEIHLYFNTTTDLTLTMPTEVKWQTQPSFKANKNYEVIFTYINSTIGWLGGVVQYG